MPSNNWCKNEQWTSEETGKTNAQGFHLGNINKIQYSLNIKNTLSLRYNIEEFICIP